jgi:hypothetical protein
MAQKNSILNNSLANTSAQIAIANQKDSMAIREIAHESKKDSSAMKLLPFSAGRYNPATFIAVLQ